MTDRERKAMRDMVTRSLMMAPTRTERGEERPRKPRRPVPLVVPEPAAHVFVLPVVNEKRL